MMMDYPSDIERAGYLAIPVLGWFEVRLCSEKNVYLGRQQPSSKTDSVVPGIREKLYYTRTLSRLQVWEGYFVRMTRRQHPDGRQEIYVSLERDGKMVHEAVGDSREQAVARAAWVAIDADEQAAWQ